MLARGAVGSAGAVIVGFSWSSTVTVCVALFVLPARLARTYAAVRGAAPHARVVVLGYPRLFELTPSCADPQVPNLARRRKLNEGADVLNAVILKTVSQQPGFSFADVRGPFAGHGVCSADPWLNGPSVPTAVGPYHPNQTGYHAGYLATLDAATARGTAAALARPRPGAPAGDVHSRRTASA